MTNEDVEEINRIVDRWYARGVTGLTDGDMSNLVRAYFELRAQIIHHSCGPREPQHDERCERQHPDYYCACPQRAALASRLPLPKN